MVLRVVVPLHRHVVLDVRGGFVALRVCQLSRHVVGRTIYDVAEIRINLSCLVRYGNLRELHRYVSLLHCQTVVRRAALQSGSAIVGVVILIYHSRRGTHPVEVVVPVGVELIGSRRIPSKVFGHNLELYERLAGARHHLLTVLANLREREVQLIPVTLVEGGESRSVKAYIY